MSQVEQKLENRVELSEKEDVERVAYCAGAYLSAFSKEPFNEKWSIDGKESSGFLLNPKTTGDFVKEVVNDEDTEIFSFKDGHEKAKVRKDLVLNHIEKTLEDPMTEFLFSEEWFSEKDMSSLLEVQKLCSNKEGFVDLDIPYPLTNVLESYVGVTKDPHSMLLLGYQENGVFDQSEEVKFTRIVSGDTSPLDVYPRVVCRYITANSPKSEERVDVQDLVLKEVGHYLTEDQENEVKNALNPDSYTTFFGELAKIPSSDRSIKALQLAGTEYINIITSLPEDGRNFGFLDLISHQLVYLSVKGTSVLVESKKESGSTKLFEGVMSLLGSLGLKYKEEVLKFKNCNNQEVVVGIITKEENIK